MPAGPASESTSLLRKPSFSSVDNERPKGLSGDRYGAINEEDAVADLKLPDLETTWQAEVKILARYSPPLIVTYLLQYSFNLVTVFVAGRLGIKELGAASLASMTANVTGLCVFEGLATCLDTLTSQAYGNGKKQLVGLHIQRMCALMLVATIPIAAIWLSSPWFLPLLVPEKDVALLAGRFMQIYLLGAPGWAFFEAAKRFTQAQGNFDSSLWVLLVCSPLNVFLNWLLVFQLKLGFEGAALAVAISNDMQPIVFALYIRLFLPASLECWPGMQWRRMFQNWAPMAKLALPGILMTAAEWTAFDILTFAASYLTAEHLAAQSVIMTVCVTIYHIPFPISIAASTRFGNLIGYGALKAARTAWKTHYLLFVGIGLMDLVILTSLRHTIAAIFTSDKVVREHITSVLPIVASAQLFDALLAISNGLLRGLGRQNIGGWVNLGVYYLLALPLSFTLTFGPPRLELAGLWVGPCLGLGLGALMMGLYMRFTDWEKAVEDARSREE
jgi:multidrug resistance protein, MATE family